MKKLVLIAFVLISSQAFAQNTSEIKIKPKKVKTADNSEISIVMFTSNKAKRINKRKSDSRIIKVDIATEKRKPIVRIKNTKRIESFKYFN